MRASLAGEDDPAKREALRVELVALEQKIALRLEALRGNAKL